MVCPTCKSKTYVESTINDNNEIYRIRKCKSCGRKIYTKEIIDSAVASYHIHSIIYAKRQKKGK